MQLFATGMPNGISLFDQGSVMQSGGHGMVPRIALDVAPYLE